MTTTELPESVAHLVGDRIHCLDAAGLTIPLSVGDDAHFLFPKTMLLARGQELVLTAEILMASLDREQNSIWALDEYEQREKFNGVPRWGFGEYPDAERRYDLANMPDNSRYIQKSTTIANYGGDRSGADTYISLSEMR